MNEIKVQKKIKRIMEECIFDNINKNMNIIDMLYVFCREFESDKCDLSYERKCNKIILHSLRVYNNAKIIVDYLETKGKIFTLEEKEDLMISSLFHDIGKLYKDSGKHPLFSSYIVEELLNKFNINDTRLIRIVKTIANHGDKKYNQNNINYITKILRDADLFDEVCGDSLLQLALENIIGKGDPMIKNLNHNDYKFSDMIINDRNDNDIKNEILEKINIEENKELYLKLLNEATERYKEITNWEVRHYKQMKGIKLMGKDTIQININ